MCGWKSHRLAYIHLLLMDAFRFKIHVIKSIPQIPNVIRQHHIRETGQDGRESKKTYVTRVWICALWCRWFGCIFVAAKVRVENGQIHDRAFSGTRNMHDVFIHVSHSWFSHPPVPSMRCKAIHYISLERNDVQWFPKTLLLFPSVLLIHPSTIQ